MSRRHSIYDGAMTLFNRDLTRSAVSGLVFTGIVVLLALLASHVLLVLFASLLVAVLLHGGGAWIAGKTGVGYGWALALFTIAILAGLVMLVVVAVPVLAQQTNELWQQLPRALDALHARLEGQSWGPALMDQFSMEEVAKSGGRIAGGATSALTSTAGAIGTFAIICVVGVFLAADPETYRSGIIALVAPSGRDRAKAVLNQIGDALQGWMAAQLLSMAVIGLLTMFGLMLLGVPLAAVLGVIAALLTFIPNLGPILAAAPALLLGLAISPLQGAYVAALYVGVQIIEGNVTTPLIQQHTVSLPPALILAMQLLMASLFGLLGLALATPLTAVMIRLTQLLYVQGFLGSEPAKRPSDTSVHKPARVV